MLNVGLLFLQSTMLKYGSHSVLDLDCPMMDSLGLRSPSLEECCTCQQNKKQKNPTALMAEKLHKIWAVLRQLYSGDYWILFWYLQTFTGKKLEIGD